MKKVLTAVQMHEVLAPNHDVTIKFSGHETINYPRTMYIAQDLGYTVFGRCDYFIKDEDLQELVNEAKEAISDYDDMEPLEYTWLESTNEYVINVGSMIIIDGLTEQAAEALHDLLLGEMGEVLYVCNSCDAIHEDETETCDLCGEDVRIVTRGDLEG